MNEKKESIRPSMLQIRSVLILQGKTLRRWSREHNYNPMLIHRAILGIRNGPKSRKALNELLSEIRQ